MLPRPTPQEPRARARMNQWINAVNSYFYPYMIYHVTHERLVFPELGIASDEKVVAHALPKIEIALLGTVGGGVCHISGVVKIHEQVPAFQLFRRAAEIDCGVEARVRIERPFLQGLALVVFIRFRDSHSAILDWLSKKIIGAHFDRRILAG